MPPLLELLTSSSLGSLLGVRHALEPDHLAAVSTLVAEQRSSRKAALLGAWWGLGHTISLLCAGAILIVLRAELPPRLSETFEVLVAAMLIALGVRAIWQAAGQGAIGPVRAHHHGRVVHAHRAGAPHVHIGTWTLARRPLLVGAVHGLAGSGALTALVLANLPSTSARLAYLGVFGLGSTLGMAVLSGVLGWPLARLGAHRGVARAITFGVGVLSIVLGIAWGYPICAAMWSNG